MVNKKKLTPFERIMKDAKDRKELSRIRKKYIKEFESGKQ